MRKQTGFTLVEIAIVLVIIGLLLGGVLKGQELVINAQAKSVANDLKNVQTLIYGYQDRFKALPGDDAAVLNHLTGTNLATPAGTVGNGVIDGSWRSNTNSDEYLFWQHVRAAGFATGTTNRAAATYRPVNAQGGALGVTGSTPIAGLTGSFFSCVGGINGKLALIVDTNLDDGNSTTGSVRISADQAVGSVAAVPVVTQATMLTTPTTQYTVCMGF